MKRISYGGLSIILSLLFILSAFGQGGENNAYQAIQDERDARRKAERIESFINQYSNSSQRPGVDKILVDYYMSNKDYAKIMQHAESFRQTQSSADPASKSFIFAQAMVAAASLNNPKKTEEYGGYALTADPNNLTVLIMLAGNNIPTPEKAKEFAERAAKVSKPATTPDANWASLQGRIHSILGGFYWAEGKMKEASTSFAMALKGNPKDHMTQFRSGMANLTLAAQAAQNAQVVNDEIIKAMAAKADAKTLEDMTNKRKELEAESIARRDASLESLANAVAIGGPALADAKKYLDAVYTSKNKSLDGEDQFVAQKKAALGL